MDGFLGRYRVEKRLGEGGMGVVWHAHDPRLRRDVALKVLPDALVADAGARDRLLREARAAAALNHPNILTIYDVGEADGHVYIAMEYIPGRPLQDVIGDGGLKTAEAVRLAQQIAAALAHAHARGVVHRDIKPSNVLVTPAGDAKVLDFGIARQVAPGGAVAESTTLTFTGAFAGTPSAMAPELWSGASADTRSDVWAFGALFHTMLTGRPPFAGKNAFELAAAISNSEPGPLPAAVPPAIGAVVARCLERAPERRYQTAAEVHAALQALAATTTTVAARAAAPPRRRGAALAIGVVAASIAAALILTWWRTRQGGRDHGPITSLAVLPLENFSHDADQQYFADGLTDELITRLAQLGVTRVISRTSIMRFRGSTQPLAAIARELGVDAIVEGSVAEGGGRVRVTAQLMRAATDEHLWAHSYERETGDALALQDEIADAIAREVQGALAPARPSAPPPSASAPHAEGKSPRAPGASPTARRGDVVQAYLRGRDQYQSWTAAGTRRAIEYFDQALALDATFTAARVARATALRYIDASPRTIALARAEIDTALAQDPGLGEAHAARANLLFEADWDWSGAESEFVRAIQLNPNDADAHHQYSHLLAALGRLAEAREQAGLMLSLDPLAPASHFHIAWLEYECGHFDRARTEARKALELDPGYSEALRLISDVEVAQHRWPDLRKVLEETRAAGGSVDPVLFRLADAAEQGRSDQGLRLVQDIASPRDAYTGWTRLAAWCVIFGSGDRAFAAIDSGYAEHDYYLMFANLDPALATLRADPRYAALRRRMRLPM